MPGDPYSAAAGAVLGIIGTTLAGNAAEDQRKRLKGIADTPGLNVGSVEDEALSQMLGNMPKAQTLAGQENQFQTGEQEKQLEALIPGWKGIQASRAAQIQSFLGGELPPDVQAQIARTAAAKASAGGYGGSGAAHALTSRDLGLTSLNLINQGISDVPGLVASTPRPGLASLTPLLGLTPEQEVALRSQERTQKMAYESQWAGAPTDVGVWGKQLQQVGGALSGTGGSGSYSALGDQLGSWSGGGGGGGGAVAPILGGAGG